MVSIISQASSPLTESVAVWIGMQRLPGQAVRSENLP